MMQVDVAVVGAGLSGLVCAQQLRQWGQQVVVVEKSRGMGGRLATRRLPGTCADHGVRYLEMQGTLTQLLIQTLVEQGLLRLWLNQIETVRSSRSGELGESHLLTKACYSASNGLTAVAKWLSADLEIWSQQRLHRLTPTDAGWHLELEPQSESKPPLLARSVVMAIPAPQALVLLTPLAAQMPDLVQKIQRVEFNPCLTAIATYPAQVETMPPWQAVEFLNGNSLAWVSLESSKGRDAQLPAIVVQSTAEFANLHLETNNLDLAGRLLLAELAKTLSPHQATWLGHPAQLQTHRWRYGLVRQPLAENCLTVTTPLPLICAGDWCGGSRVEDALASGLAAASQTERLLKSAAANSPEAISSKSDFSALLQSLP